MYNIISDLGSELPASFMENMNTSVWRRTITSYTVCREFTGHFLVDRFLFSYTAELWFVSSTILNTVSGVELVVFSVINKLCKVPFSSVFTQSYFFLPFCFNFLKENTTSNKWTSVQTVKSLNGKLAETPFYISSWLNFSPPALSDKEGLS